MSIAGGIESVTYTVKVRLVETDFYLGCDGCVFSADAQCCPGYTICGDHKQFRVVEIIPQ